MYRLSGCLTSTENLTKKSIAPSLKKQRPIALFAQISTYAPQQKKPGFSLNLPFPCSIFAKNPVSELSGPSLISDYARDHHENVRDHHENAHRENVHRENDRARHENDRALHENDCARGALQPNSD